MKKVLSMVMVLMLLLAMCSVNVFAAEETTVYVTVSDANGKLVLAQEAITVTDADKDGALTVNDALYAAHEAKYEGGAAAGYASSTGAYGLSLDKLWGTANGGSYGYYVNNTSSTSLADTVKEGDFINAYVITDLTAWSDTYCYFDANTVSAKAGEEINLKLSAAGYDANWNPITVPVADAAITLNGVATAYKTDAEGKVTLKVEEAGNFVVSATSETQVLVPPVCVATVEAVETVATEAPAATETTTPNTPNTGDNNDEMLLYVLIAIIALVLILILIVTRKKPNGK